MKMSWLGGIKQKVSELRSSKLSEALVGFVRRLTLRQQSAQKPAWLLIPNMQSKTASRATSSTISSLVDSPLETRMSLAQFSGNTHSSSTTQLGLQISSLKFNIPLTGVELVLNKPWRFRLDYIPVNYKLYKAIGHPNSKPLYSKVTSADNVWYNFTQSVPNTYLAQCLDFQYIVFDQKVRRLPNKPNRIYDIFHSEITLGTGTILVVVSITLQKNGRLQIMIKESAISELKGFIISVSMQDAERIEYLPP